LFNLQKSGVEETRLKSRSSCIDKRKTGKSSTGISRAYCWTRIRQIGIKIMSKSKFYRFSKFIKTKVKNITIRTDELNHHDMLEYFVFVQLFANSKVCEINNNGSGEIIVCGTARSSNKICPIKFFFTLHVSDKTNWHLFNFHVLFVNKPIEISSQNADAHFASLSINYLIRFVCWQMFKILKRCQ
jgi:hypothetical protein